MTYSRIASNVLSAPVPRLLFLGGGAVARELHIRALERLRWCAAATVLDVSDHAAAELRKLYPTLAVYQDSFREVLRRPQTKASFDGVVITLPNNMHEEAVALSLEAGLPVLCEKPLANESEACRRLDRIAKQHNCPLSVAMVRRLIPWVCAARNGLRGGLVGDLESITIEHGGRFQWPTQSENYFSKEHGGLLVNMGVHYLDMVEDWVGPLVPLEYADDFKGGVEANFAFRLLTNNGARVRLKLSYTHQLQNEVVLRGSKGKITADVNSFDECIWQSYETGTTATLRPTRPFRSGDWPRDLISCFVEQFHEFHLVIRGEETPRVSADSSAATLEIIEWGYRNRRHIFSAPGPRSTPRPALEAAPAVVTGGTGFIGGKLVERLAELRFRDVRVPMRTVMTSANVARFPVQRVLADLLDYPRIESALKDVRYVFHLAYGTAEATVHGTRNVVDAAIAMGAEVVVVVSTASVFGLPRAATPIDEKFPYRPALGEYGHSKAKAERYALQRAKSSSPTRIVVVNPSAVYGPSGSLFTEFPARAVREGGFCWIEHGRGKLNYVYVDNLVDALLLAAQIPKAHGERFIINDGVTTVRKFLTPLLDGYAETLPSLTRRQLVDIECSGQPGFRDFLRALTNDEMMTVINGVPALAVAKRFAARRLAPSYQRLKLKRQALHAVAASAPPILRPSSWLADIFGPIEIEFSSAKARDVLGWSPRVTLEEGIQASIEWLRYVGLWAPDPVYTEEAESVGQISTPNPMTAGAI
jgi:nucleoside-diphosphate-sugar epimerase/predicted dehydrogenase